jgi:Fe-S metabolism associated domain
MNARSVPENGTRTDMTIDEITENFALLDDWDDRYRYLIELGRTLAPINDRAVRVKFGSSPRPSRTAPGARS